MKTILKMALVAAVLAAGGPALALNPQPEPPIYYHGMEYVIIQTGDDGWRWEVRERQSGRPPRVLSRGQVRGSHDAVVAAVHDAIDHLTAAPPLRRPSPPVRRP